MLKYRKKKASNSILQIIQLCKNKKMMENPCNHGTTSFFSPPPHPTPPHPSFWGSVLRGELAKAEQAGARPTPLGCEGSLAVPGQPLISVGFWVFFFFSLSCSALQLLCPWGGIRARWRLQGCLSLIQVVPTQAAPLPWMPQRCWESSPL